MHSSDIAYERRAAEMDRDYVRSFRALTPERRLVLKKHGIAGPQLEDHFSRQGAEDISDYTDLAALPPDVEHSMLCDYLVEHFGVPPSMVEALLEWEAKRFAVAMRKQRDIPLARLVSKLLRQHNPQVAVAGLAFAMDLHVLNNIGWRTMQEAAKALGCSKSYISEQANYFCDLFELPRPSKMKDGAARVKYSEKRGELHWRHKNFKPKAQRKEATP